MKNFIIYFSLCLVSTGCSVFGIRSEETPRYEVLIKNKNMEIRQYAPYIVATTFVDGSFKDSQGKAFRILAGYIFGSNEKASKISMTAPVVMNPQQSKSEKISMTAPVTQAPKGNGWEMSFMMPSKYSKIEDLPKPKDTSISFKQIESRPIAVISFTGFWSEEKNRKKADQLTAWILEQGQYEIISAANFAGYDPPWTLPFLRRNEMMIELKKR